MPSEAAGLGVGIAFEIALSLAARQTHILKKAVQARDSSSVRRDRHFLFTQLQEQVRLLPLKRFDVMTFWCQHLTYEKGNYLS